ncbi:cytochrome P450 [Artomyces pyxidatus]|uniref:Cytochrome P450 n=1 Tax=Artomyces pyxidatus TaxID=48021 RepID=A0ACB8T0A4_9AGAM|nr:cytochrome P450 [Artomyces pyxidatus]
MSFVPSLTTVASTVLAAAIIYLLHPLGALLLALYCSPLQYLPSPPYPSILTGNLAAIADQENTDVLRTWAATYGPTYTYRGFIGGRRLLTTDPEALAWILGRAYDFPKPDFVTESLAAMVAGREGLLTVDGDVHRRQVRPPITSQAFSTPHIKTLVPIFSDKARRLRDIFLRLSEKPSQPSRSPPQPPEKGQVVDVLAWLGRATLDVIGEAGFGYHFDALPDPSDPACDPADAPSSNSELAHAFGVIFSTARKFRVMTVLQVWFPVLRRFRPNNKTMEGAQATMRRIGMQLIAERRADAECQGRDILSVLVRANTASDPTHALTLNEILSQISTFLAAGHETTASALCWTLFALARAPDIQRSLRAALRALPTAPCGDVDIDALLRLPVLEHAVREALRLHAPVGSTMRVYRGDAPECVVPVRRGVRVRQPRRWPWSGGDEWKVEYGVRLRRGDIVTIPIQAVNRDPEVWGADAREFRPDRWDAPPAAAADVPGLYAHILTFLNGSPVSGNRACIGYKFALTEIKVFLYYLLRDIEFTLDADVVIEKRVNIVTRPFVASAPELGNQMPLRIRRVPPSET